MFDDPIRLREFFRPFGTVPINPDGSETRILRAINVVLRMVANVQRLRGACASRRDRKAA